MENDIFKYKKEIEDARRTIERLQEKNLRLEETLENKDRILEEICDFKANKVLKGRALGIIRQALGEASSLLYSEFESVCDDNLREQYDTTTTLVDKALELIDGPE